jgi:hypothetical protein
MGKTNLLSLIVGAAALVALPVAGFAAHHEEAPAEAPAEESTPAEEAPAEEAPAEESAPSE